MSRRVGLLCGPAFFALYNRNCGHVFGIGPGRAGVERQRAAAQLTGKKVAHGLRIRRARRGDTEAVLAGVRCERCAFDTPPAPAGSEAS